MAPRRARETGLSTGVREKPANDLAPEITPEQRARFERLLVETGFL